MHSRIIETLDDILNMRLYDGKMFTKSIQKIEITLSVLFHIFETQYTLHIVVSWVFNNVHSFH